MNALKYLNIVEDKILVLLNDNASALVSQTSLSSPRAIGDAVQMFLSEYLEDCFPKGVIKNMENDFERRSMEDMAFYDYSNCYFAIDAKTHNCQTVFNMPNLISVQRLAKFYRNDTNYFCILLVEYEIQNNAIWYKKCHFKPIEQFSWECLSLGALGWGQIQIANANRLKFQKTINRKAWMLQFFDLLSEFYDAEIGKIGQRKLFFDQEKEYWLHHD